MINVTEKNQTHSKTPNDNRRKKKHENVIALKRKKKKKKEREKETEGKIEAGYRSRLIFKVSSEQFDNQNDA